MTRRRLTATASSGGLLQGPHPRLQRRQRIVLARRDVRLRRDRARGYDRIRS